MLHLKGHSRPRLLMAPHRSGVSDNCARTQVNNMLVIPIFRNANDVASGVLILVNKREGFVLDDARKLEHYRSAIFPCVDCICRSESASTKTAQR